MIFLLFVFVTLAEIYVLASVGGAIGGFWTVALVILTAFLGSFLLKQQGFATLKKAQNSIQNGQAPSIELLEGVVILVSGVLLLTPGFLTDFVGLLGLLPFSRGALIQYFLLKNANRIFKKTSVFTHKASTKNRENNQQNKIIEGEFWED